MKIIHSDIPNLFVLEPNVITDSRGYFFESFNEKAFESNHANTKFVQDNQSKSTFGVLRGLHYQLAPFAQAKLVRVLSGEVLDVAVDIRQGSPTFMNWHAEILSAENKKQLFIPRGFAHGFVVLSETAEFFYKCDNFYSKEHEAGIHFDDPDLNIDWKIDQDKVVLSEKDGLLPNAKNAKNNFTFKP